MNTHLIRYRPPRIAMLLVGLAAAWHYLLPTPVWFSFGAIALLSGSAGFFIMMWAWWQFRQRRVAICPTAETDALITDGVYRYTRNPMYLGIVLMLSGVALWAGTLPFALAAAGFFLVINAAFCPYEEQKLANTFGPDYAAYRRRVRRWV